MFVETPSHRLPAATAPFSRGLRRAATRGRPYKEFGPLLSVGAGVPIGPNRRRVREAAPCEGEGFGGGPK